jgi:hypothetical protein
MVHIKYKYIVGVWKHEKVCKGIYCGACVGGCCGAVTCEYLLENIGKNNEKNVF